MHSINTKFQISNFHHRCFSRLNGPVFTSPVSFERNFEKRVENYGGTVLSCQYLGLKELWSGKDLDNTWSCWCKRSEEEDDVGLEIEIMDFMLQYEKPTMFPTKKELIEAGRADLAEAIEKKGGWYALGWDEEENVEESIDVDVDIKKFQGRVESCKESACPREHSGDSVSGNDNEDGFSCELNLDFLQLDDSASLGRSLEIGEDSGTEGMLCKLEKQRNNDFGLNFGINESVSHAGNKEDTHFDTSLSIDNGTLTHQEGKISQNREPENWRTWSYQQAGFQQTEFEAAEISFSKDRVETDKESYDDVMFVRTGDWYKYEQINYNQIRTRLQHLEYELTSAIDSLRSKRKECISDEVTGSSSDLRKLSDEWEFQENEFMRAKEGLRSLRAQLAVLEGKMALAILDAQEIFDQKQKRIDGACKALQLLRNTFIVWYSSASEVLLAGSFDGWTSQRKMERRSPGSFSLCLKLYPGRYEVKFIVDGIWKVDPLLPILKKNGYENNLLIVT